ncbi:MAG: NAD(P)/FAD-dependent oxidoreductase [Desulfitobacteriaceae bacterium]
MKKVIIVGGSFGGLTAAFELRRHLGRKVEITLVTETDYFAFAPSFPWVALGSRKPDDITVGLDKLLSRKGIKFLQATVQKIDPGKQEVDLGNIFLSYDYLVIATGAHLDFEAIPGLGPEKGYTYSIMTLEHAVKTNQAWQQYLETGGPIVIGCTQGVSCFGPAYELIFGAEHALWKLGLREKASLTFVTSEPYISHFGLGGFRQAGRVIEDEFAEKDIKVFTNAVVKEIQPDRVILGDGAELPFKFSLFVPPFRGVDAVINSGLGNPKGFVVVDDYYRHKSYPNIYVTGVAVAVSPKEATPVPTGVPKTGFMTEHMSKVVARNIAAEILGRELQALPVSKLDVTCIADLGKHAAFMTAKPALPPRQKTYLKKGRWAHSMKVIFERYFLFKLKRGAMNLP